MSFSAAWLELREPYDRRARNAAVIDAVVAAPAGRPSVTIAAVNKHQRTDKGFGPALGPEAARKAVEQFERVGYSVVQGASDWMFAPADREIQNEILAGWAAAARELGDIALPEVLSWLTRR